MLALLSEPQYVLLPHSVYVSSYDLTSALQSRVYRECLEGHSSTEKKKSIRV